MRVGQAARLVGQPIPSDVNWQVLYPIFTDNDEVTTVLTPVQANSLNDFLRDPRTRALLGARALARLSVSDALNYQMLIDSIRTDFLTLASAGGIADLDTETVELIWERMGSQIDEIYINLEFTNHLLADERAALQEAQAPLEIDKTKASKAPSWLRDLVTLATDLERLRSAEMLSCDIRQAALASSSELRLDHALDDSRRPISDLYVHRNLRGKDGSVTSTETVLSDNYRSRVVITGPPGGGKTTLTQHLIYALSSTSGGSSTPMRVRVREMNPGSSLLIHEIGESLTRDYQIPDVRREAVEDLLTLGRAYVVFDGLDEVLDIGTRRRLIGQIEAFSKRYPMCSVLVTSRDIGYDEASLTEGLFHRYRLIPFDDDQVGQYAEAWFRDEAHSKDITEAFLRDLAPVPDLRYNPLMLSLLCTLYKARGHIPRNRRHVYLTCADLLFNRWDSMRRIEQPVDHVDHGQDLMQDIALFFFRSDTAQKGVQERQLQKIVAQFLRDSAGVFEAQANSRARSFLDFCAGRAWLLGKAGNTPSGERLFIFTHRTFMEFFAAEGLARRSNSTADMVNVICDAYMADPSSVLPELIVSAAEASHRGAARAIVGDIRARGVIGGRGLGRYLPLRVRIASVLALQPNVQNDIIDDAFSHMETGSLSETRETRDAILDLPRDARARVEAYLTDPKAMGMDATRGQLLGRQQAFIRCWSEMLIRGTGASYAIEWQQTVDKVWAAVSSCGSRTDSDPLLRHYASHFDRDWLRVQPADLTWMTREDDLPIPTIAALSLERGLAGRQPDSLDLSIVASYKVHGPGASTLDEGEGHSFVLRLEEMLDNRVGVTCEHASYDWIRPLGLGAALAYWEFLEEDGTHLMELAALSGENLATLTKIRRTGHIQPSKRPFVQAVARRNGEWVREWLRGRFHFVSS